MPVGVLEIDLKYLNVSPGQNCIAGEDENISKII